MSDEYEDEPGNWHTVGTFQVSDYVESATRMGFELLWHSPGWALLRAPSGGYNVLEYVDDSQLAPPGVAWMAIPRNRAVLRTWITCTANQLDDGIQGYYKAVELAQRLVP